MPDDAKKDPYAPLLDMFGYGFRADELGWVRETAGKIVAAAVRPWRKQVIRAALLHGGCRTTQAVVGHFSCACCERILPASDCAGGFWTGWADTNGHATGEHLLVCRQCSENPHWQDKGAR